MNIQNRDFHDIVNKVFSGKTVKYLKFINILSFEFLHVSNNLGLKLNFLVFLPKFGIYVN